MKTFVALVALFAVALAARAPARRLVPVKPIVHQLSARSAFAAPAVRAPAVAVVPRTFAVAQPRTAAVGSTGSDVVVLKETLHNNLGIDGYQYNYQLSDGSSRDENAQVEIRGVEDAVLRVSGSYQYVAQDGQTYTVTYVADENGFQPQGAHLPVPPQLR